MCATGRGAKVPGTFSETGEKAGLGLGDSEGVQRKGLPSHHRPPAPQVKLEETCGRFPKPGAASVAPCGPRWGLC